MPLHSQQRRFPSSSSPSERKQVVINDCITYHSLPTIVSSLTQAYFVKVSRQIPFVISLLREGPSNKSHTFSQWILVLVVVYHIKLNTIAPGTVDSPMFCEDKLKKSSTLSRHKSHLGDFRSGHQRAIGWSTCC